MRTIKIYWVSVPANIYTLYDDLKFPEMHNNAFINTIANRKKQVLPTKSVKNFIQRRYQY